MSFNISSVYNKPYIVSAGNNYKNNNIKAVSFSGQELITPEVQEKMLQIAAEIEKADKIAIVTHNNPDGDAVGSSAALKNLIASKYPNKKIDVFMVGAVPHGAKCLNDAGSFEHLDKKSNLESIKARNYNLAISVDCASTRLMRDGSKIFNSAPKKIKIDHHPDGDNYADINLVCGEASAASQVMLLLADYMGVKLNKELASDVYLGLITDTQGFRYMKKPGDIFDDCSKLTQTGIDTRKIYTSSMDYMPKAALKFYAQVLNNIKFAEDGKIAYIVDDSIAEKDGRTGRYINKSKTLNKEGLEKADIKSVFDRVVGVIMPNIEGVKIAAKINEQDDRIKGSIDTGASLRGNGVSVKELAEKYDGGGHEFAAAFIGAKETASEFVQNISNYLKSKEQQNT